MLLFFKHSSGYSKICFYCLSFTCVIAIGSGYNLNTVSPKVFTDPNAGNSRASYFGFSTAFYVKSDDDGHREASVLVGAPRANASAIPSVLEPGTVFNCAINDDNDDKCIEWNLDPSGNGKAGIVAGYAITQLKNNAWTGGTIGVDYSTIKYPRVVVCAPNWKQLGRENWSMLGMCYWSIRKTGNIFEQRAEGKIIPLVEINKKHCPHVPRVLSQPGFSMQVYSEKNQSHLLLGSPGMAQSRGSPILIEVSDNFAPIIPSCIEKNKLTVLCSYLGYSVTSGDYHNDGNRWYAAGAPRSKYLMGKVVIFQFERDKGTLNVPNDYKLQGTQTGEYFGASLASCDLNNDGKDEIIVGAPFWSNEMDEGRIYVFSENHRKFTKIRVIDGTKSGARFGSVVTCLGDLDHDGYKDIAVGAPYEENHGAVYIYNGKKEGLNKDFSQRIYGEDISKSIRGFGAAISEPRDVDDNHYVDVAIGAYNSGHVVLLRSQPVVTIKVHFPEDTTKILQTNTKSLKINVCCTCDGFRIPEKLEIETTLKVDRLKAYFGRNSNANGLYKQTDFVVTSETNCISYDLTLVKSNLKNPIKISASLALVESSSEKFCAECPIVNEQKSKLNATIEVNFASYCGRGTLCISIIDTYIWPVSGDLENSERYTLGSNSPVGLKVLVNSTGQPAHNAKLHFFIPSPIFPVHTLPGCDHLKKDNFWEIICPLGNPLEKDAVEMTFQLDMSDVRSDTERIEFFANVSTQSFIVKESKYFANFTIYFDVDVKMEITGKSQPDVHSFDSEDEAQKQKSIRAQHIYTVQKFGKSPMEDSNVTIWVPTHLRENDIEVARVIENFVEMDEQLIDCQISDENHHRQIVDELKLSVQSTSSFSESLFAENFVKSPDNRSVEESNPANNSKLYVPPPDRTFYLNCTNQAVKCIEISCKLNKFEISNTVAKITIEIELQLGNLIPTLMKTKDIIYLVSNASIDGITRSGEIYERIGTNFNSTSIGTTFVGSPKSLPVATWIIVVSILSGLLLLVLLILGLIKLGFFHRGKREELEALKAKNDDNPALVLDTSSSREVSDAI